MIDNFEDSGTITNLSAFQKPGKSDTILLIGRAETGGQWTRVLTHGAATALWFYLVKILFPRAAGQLTPRMATAALRDADSPKVATMVRVRVNEETGMIEVGGIGGRHAWVIRFDHEEGYELWASLEGVLGTTGTVGDHLPD